MIGRVRRPGLVVATAVALVSGCVAVPVPVVPSPGRSGTPRPAPPEILAGLVDAHNQERARRHLPLLEVDSRLEAAARGHAEDMARRHRMSHRGSGGTTPFTRIRAAGYAFRTSGENIAAGEFSLESLMSAWMHSPGHRHNILGRFSQIGAACATDEAGRTYWCVTFGAPAELPGPS